MGVMKTLSLARTSVVIHSLLIATIAIIVVALLEAWFVLLRTNRYVRTVVIWTSPSVKASVIMRSHGLRIHIGGLAPTAPKDVFATHLDAMAISIVTMAAMN